MPFAEVRGTRLFFTDEGTGTPPIVFVHGYTCDSHDWSWQLAHFEHHHRVIAVDLRGHGRSDAPAEGYEPASLASDVAALLAELACGPVVAVGHSLGGLVVSVLAVEHPDQISAVIAVDPGYLVADEISEGMGPFVEGMSQGDPVEMVQALLGPAHAPASPAALRTWHLRRIAGVAPHVLRQTLAGMSASGESLTARAVGQRYLRQRRCPFLSFYVDPTRVPVEQALFADPRSNCVSWEGAGHWLHQERPQEFNHLVETWLASLSADR